jgi:hypothetical protein
MDRNESFLLLNSKLKRKLIYVIEKGNFFFMVNLRFITYGIREKVTTLGLNRATLIA